MWLTIIYTIRQYSSSCSQSEDIYLSLILGPRRSLPDHRTYVFQIILSICQAITGDIALSLL